MDPTQEGASGSVEEGAAAILAQLEGDDSPPETENQATEETETTTQAEGEDAAQAESETENTEVQEEEGEAFASISELAEANGWELEDVLALSVDVKVDGEVQQTTLSEVVKNFQIDSHVRNKERQVSDKMKELSSLEDQSREKINQRLATFDDLVSTAEQKLISDAQKIDWDELKEFDPEQYLMKKQELQENVESIQSLKSKAQEERQKADIEYATKEKEKLMQLPDFSTPENFNQNTRAVAEYLQSQGFTPDEISGTIDHRAIAITLKAKKYDELQAKKPLTEKKVKGKPKVLKPGAQKTKQQISDKQRQEKLTRLKKSGGKYQDAASLMEDLL